MAVLDGPGFFRNTLIASTPIAGAIKRVPFSFTSTARLLKSGKISALGSKFIQLESEQNISAEIGAIEAETRGIRNASQLGLSGIVNRFRNVEQLAVGTDMSVISMAINPNTIRWSQNKRISKRDTMEGSVFFHFTNNASQNNDILTMSFSGQTGNINTQANIFDVYATGAALKLRIWHELYNLTREGLLLNEETTNKVGLPFGLRNEFFITYRSILMPRQITLVGFFSKVMDFAETANDPYNRDYSFDFTVTHTFPSLDKLSSMMRTDLSVPGQIGGGII